MTHKIEISDKLFTKADEIRKQKKCASVGAALEYYIKKLEVTK